MKVQIPILSLPDVFYLSLHLSLPPPGVAHLPHYPQCIYTCVLCLSVASSFCFVKPTSVCPLAPVCSCSYFVVFPGFELSACADPVPACRSIPCHTSLDYWPMPALTLRLPAILDLLHPFWITDLCLPLTCRLPAPVLEIHFCYFDTVCIWVTPQTWYPQTQKYQGSSLIENRDCGETAGGVCV